MAYKNFHSWIYKGNFYFQTNLLNFRGFFFLIGHLFGDREAMKENKTK